MDGRTRPGTRDSRVARSEALGTAGSRRRAGLSAARAGVRTAMLWLVAVTAIAAGCQMPGSEPPGQPESQPTETPASKPIEQPDEPDGPPDEQSEQPDGLPALVIADVSAGEGDALLRFPVSLSATAAEPVTVAYATEDGTATAGADYTAVSGTLTFAVASTEARRIEVPVRDDAIAEETETFTMRLSDPQGATLAAATATIVDDDRRSVVTYPTELNVEEGAAGSYVVVLGAQPTAPVTVTVTVAETAELSIAPYEVVFTAASWRQRRTVTVTAAEDEDALADASVELRHAARGGGYDGLAAAVEVTIVENDVPTLAAAAARAAEGAGRLRFAVSLSVASDNAVTVDWGTGAAGDTARAGADYTAASGELSFPAGSTEARTIEVVVRDDALDEPDEAFTVTLSNPVHAQLAGGRETATATGTIEDDDEAPELTIADAGGSESDGAMVFTVRLDQASGRTVMVDYATADVTAIAGADYTGASGKLSFPASSTERTIEVVVRDDALDEPDEAFTVTLSNPVHAELAGGRETATGTIEDDDEAPLELASLEVTGGAGTMYPPFDPDTHHYALTCHIDSPPQVTARATRGGATLKLLRADPSQIAVATGTLTTSLAVGWKHDIVIELSDAGETTRYVVHCLPLTFPNVVTTLESPDASPGLLFVGISALSLRAIIDKNGVPRYHEFGPYRNFRPHHNGPVIDGRTVRYSASRQNNSIHLLDASFQKIRDLRSVAGIKADSQDYYVTEDDTFLFISYHPATRDYSQYVDENGDPYSSTEAVKDSVIQEVSAHGTELFRWNSWGNINLDPDCRLTRFTDDYARLNSLYVQNGDVVASFRRCGQILKLDRSSGTWAVEWKLGGTAATPDADTDYLEIVGDPAGEFCGQHQATLTDAGTVVLFDNGEPCLGPRKSEPVFTRVVEYAISAETNQAIFLREYRRPESHGHTPYEGGVTVLDNGHWLIAWGPSQGSSVRNSEIFSISEVDPYALPGPAAVFHVHINRADGTGRLTTYRVYREPEADVDIPLNLP